MDEGQDAFDPRHDDPGTTNGVSPRATAPATYAIAEITGPTLQGEGAHAGWPCLILRLAGCNAWDGRPATRAASACPWCDTDFRSRERLDLPAIMARLTALLPSDPAAHARYGCLLTGGEPLLQADKPLLASLAARFAWVDIETNGTRPCPPRPANVHLGCSPKAVPGQPVVATPDWWKILVPDPHGFLSPALDSGVPVYVQPVCPAEGLDSPAYRRHLATCLDLCRRHGCRLSLQMHKHLGIV